ncbi:response regulator [Lichenihabitans sp. PAMC28606]|uniref:response regulator n=1 Tax=Lichenihabitans sp. PAMC28606 TaxID=2880932 RepID=UPI001D09A939|nr:response regulator [Lichenihabitans sp. PAMC28606]UDL95521.1 response regulator [Lichenihabitans sp. PAMC28606]
MTEIDHSPSSRLSGCRVLVVEDEILLAFELIDELQELGAIPIGPVPTVAEALAAIEATAIDAAMLNVHLRGQLSFAIANTLVERNIPFIFVTGNGSFVQEHFLDIPAYLKPYDLPEIVDALELLIKKSEKTDSEQATKSSQ